MGRTKIYTLFAIGVLSLAQVGQGGAAADPLRQTSPPGFSLVISDTGTELYRNDQQDGNPDFVQTVNLGQGAFIKLLHGEVADRRTGKGVYGGDGPSFVRQTLLEVWDQFLRTEPTAFCLTNGQFFSTDEDPTQLAFPLKRDGEVVSDGYGIDEYLKKKLILEIWTDRADIVPLTQVSLYGSSAPDIIAGLTEDADKGPLTYTGRTFVGVDDLDGNGKYEVVLVFNSLTARQDHASDVLRAFGADKVMMLDGGGSTQLICKSATYIKSSRTIPQTLAVGSGTAASQGSDDLMNALKGRLQLWLDALMQTMELWIHEQTQRIEGLLTSWLQERMREMVEELATQTCASGIALPLAILTLHGHSRFRRKSMAPPDK